MIIHATRKLAQRLPDVSSKPLTETSPLGSWHTDRLTIDRRQCVLFCHDETCAALFAAGLRKPQFTVIGNDVFKPLFADTLAALGCPDVQVRRALLMLGRCQFDTATDRSFCLEFNARGTAGPGGACVAFPERADGGSG